MSYPTIPPSMTFVIATFFLGYPLSHIDSEWSGCANGQETVAEELLSCATKVKQESKWHKLIFCPCQLFNILMFYNNFICVILTLVIQYWHDNVTVFNLLFILFGNCLLSILQFFLSIPCYVSIVKSIFLCSIPLCFALFCIAYAFYISFVKALKAINIPHFRLGPQNK